LSERKYKLGDDGELEEIIDEGDEKPKRKRKPKLYNRTFHIPLSLMLVLIVSVILLVLITYSITRPSGQPVVVTATSTAQPRPSETPGGYLDKIPPCGMLPITQNPRFAYRVDPSGGDAELLRIDMDGTNSCRLTNNNVDDGWPSWSPDGKKLCLPHFSMPLITIRIIPFIS
jgi:hypothetical protein